MTDNNMIKIPKFSASDVEKTKKFTFSLQPSTREKINTLAKQYNFSSASKFLNELIKKM